MADGVVEPVWRAVPGLPSGAGAALEPSPLEGAAVRALDRAQDAAAAARGYLVAAGGVEWTGPAAATFRQALEEVTDRLRSADTRLDDARWAVARHADAVRSSGATILSGAPVAAPWSPAPWSPAPRSAAPGSAVPGSAVPGSGP